MPDPSKRILELLTELDGILESRIAGTGDVTVADAMGITELHEAVESALSDDRIWDPGEETDG